MSASRRVVHEKIARSVVSASRGPRCSIRTKTNSSLQMRSQHVQHPSVAIATKILSEVLRDATR